jgi:hypothetical protein
MIVRFATKFQTDQATRPIRIYFLLLMETQYTMVVSTVSELIILSCRLTGQLRQPGTHLHSDDDLKTPSDVGRVSETIASAERR